jgi:diguanylate cyclase (GGDEF)-like protein
MQPAGALFDRAPVPIDVAINPRGAAAFGALVLATLLVGLFAYRRRTYILQWASGWLLIAISLALLSREWPILILGRVVVGLSQLAHVGAALLFLLSADNFRQKPRFNPKDAWFLLPVGLWFSLAPLALGVNSVMVPGYVLAMALYAVASVAYILLLKRTKLVGAGVTGVTFMLIALLHAWLAQQGTQNPATWDTSALAALIPASLLALAAGLGMHVLVFEDLTWELRQTNRRLEAAHVELEHLVITDPLTGCHNRRFFLEVINREVQRHRRYNTPLSVLFVDVDHFKDVNDTLGHEAGDAALRLVAEFLRKNVREADFLFRWGGDEFLMLLTCTEAEAERKGSELRRVFAEWTSDRAYPAGFGLSIGAAELPPDRADFLSVIKDADARMYREKTRTRGRITRQRRRRA